MVGLHLGAKCLVCVEPFPAADRQEDTSAKLLCQFIPQYRMENTPKVTPLKKMVTDSSRFGFRQKGLTLTHTLKKYFSFVPCTVS